MRVTRMAPSIVAALVLVLASAATAGASRADAGSSTGNFCGVSKNVAQYLVSLEDQLRSSPAPTKLKAEFGAITRAEPALKSSAPASLKGHVNQVLAFANVVGADLKKANWNVAGLLPYVASLQVQEAKVKPSLTALDRVLPIDLQVRRLIRVGQRGRPEGPRPVGGLACRDGSGGSCRRARPRPRRLRGPVRPAAHARAARGAPARASSTWPRS